MLNIRNKDHPRNVKKENVFALSVSPEKSKVKPSIFFYSDVWIFVFLFLTLVGLVVYLWRDRFKSQQAKNSPSKYRTANFTKTFAHWSPDPWQLCGVHTLKHWQSEILQSQTGAHTDVPFVDAGLKCEWKVSSSDIYEKDLFLNMCLLIENLEVNFSWIQLFNKN